MLKLLSVWVPIEKKRVLETRFETKIVKITIEKYSMFFWQSNDSRRKTYPKAVPIESLHISAEIAELSS